MDVKTMSKKTTHRVQSIGTVRRDKDTVFLDIAEAFRPGLTQLNHFSHLIVLWWADQQDNEESRRMLQTYPPYAEDKLTGVFACRSEYRPNPIAVTVCKILGVEEQEGRVLIGNIDAFDGTQILDLKPYFPVCDRVKNASIPEWLVGWPNWLPERGLGLEY
jgi:tRNA-Thr(GGU) m(6)t(6)A37 methyltransferase TsaA